jgi:NTE family protein
VNYHLWGVAGPSDSKPLKGRFPPTCVVLVILICLLLGVSASEANSEGDTSTYARSQAVANWCKAALKIPDERRVRELHVTSEGRTVGFSSNTPDVSPEPILALSLSGGGYRAMLFHVGTLRRLNESGLLAHISVVSSVSGGSVTAAYLAHRWNDLRFDDSDRAANFEEVVEAPLRRLARKTLDIPSVIRGLFPFSSSAMEQVKKFDLQLFNGALLADIAPGGRNDDTKRPRPLFILNATNLQTGELWQFRSSAIGGPITHWTAPGTVLLAEAVAASSGFPPFLSPLILGSSWSDVRSTWYDCSNFRDNPYGIHYRNEPGRVLPQDDDSLTSFRREIYLADGGIRDNLGISTIEEINRLRRLDGIDRVTVTLISDGGAITDFDATPSSNWASQSLRVLNLIADQPDEVRVANIIRAGSSRLRNFGWNATESGDECPSVDVPEDLERARRRAANDRMSDAYAYWSIRRRPKLHRGFECPQDVPRWMVEEVRALSSVRTAFRAMPDELQARLINWGYLAAHHGLPYVDAAWPDPAVRRRWLTPCSLPYGPQVTDPKGESPSARDPRCLGFASSGDAIRSSRSR